MMESSCTGTNALLCFGSILCSSIVASPDSELLAKVKETVEIGSKSESGAKLPG